LDGGIAAVYLPGHGRVDSFVVGSSAGDAEGSRSPGSFESGIRAADAVLPCAPDTVAGRASATAPQRVARRAVSGLAESSSSESAISVAAGFAASTQHTRWSRRNQERCRRT